MGQHSRWQRAFRLIILSVILCAGSLQGVRAFAIPETIRAAAPACPPPFLTDTLPTNNTDCQARVAAATSLPPDFSESTIFSELEQPTSVRFAPDGRIFIAEKSGIVKMFASLEDTAPTIVVDLRTEVQDYWDRGLLSIVLDPNYGTTPYLYALYTYDAPPGGIAPT